MIPTAEKIYLAGPWFTPDQMETQKRIETICEFNGWPVFSPRIELTLPKNSTKEEQARAFFLNVHGLRKCRLILANVEGYDTGTLWEMGAAYAYDTPVVIYSPNPDRKLNVMLAQGSKGFLAGWEAIEKFLIPQAANEKRNYHFDWEVATPWKSEVF